jgi:hypothetical protein
MACERSVRSNLWLVFVKRHQVGDTGVMKTQNALFTLTATLLLVGCPSGPNKSTAKPTQKPAAVTTPPKTETIMSELKRVEPQRATKKAIDTKGLTTALEGPTSFTAEDVKLTFVVQNPTGEGRTFCDYHTPFEGIRNNIFELVDAAGKQLEYRGVMAKRAAPDLNNYLVVPPKSKIQVTFDLSQGYGALAVGKYTLRFTGNGISGLPASNTITLTINTGATKKTPNSKP